MFLPAIKSVFESCRDKLQKESSQILALSRTNRGSLKYSRAFFRRVNPSLNFYFFIFIFITGAIALTFSGRVTVSLPPACENFTFP